MPRGQQKRKATGTSTTGQPPVRRRSTAATATYAARTTATTTRAEAEHGEREEPLTSAGRVRWAVDQPANWSTAKLRSLIEEGRGLKLPSGMKKPQLLRMYLDNCHTGADADVPGTSAAAAELSDEAETTAAAYDSEPRPSHVTPTTRWGIAADLNGIATRARQRHQPTVSAADVTYVPVQDDADIRLRLRERRADSSRPLLRDVAAATSNSGEISEVEPLSDAVRNLQQAMFTLSRQMGDIVQSQRDSASIAPQMMPPPSVPSTSSRLPQRPTVFTLTTAMERLEQSTGVSSRCAPTTALTDCPVGRRGFTSEDLPEVEVVPTAVRAAILDDEPIPRASTRGSTHALSLSNTGPSNVVLDDVIDKLWDRAINRSTRAVYEAGFRAFHRFSNLYPSGSLSSTHPAISEDILIYFVAHCVDTLQLKYSTIKTYLAGTRFAYIKAGFQDPCCFPNGQQYLRLRAILKAVKKSQDNTVKPRLPITASILSQCCQSLRSGFLGAYEDLVLETAFCMAYFGFLRCGEFTCKSHIFDPHRFKYTGYTAVHR